MSDDQLDNDLKKRIKQVFDNYEDNTANEGWQRLREKFPEEEKDRAVFWLWWRVAGVAALLLMALGVGLWSNFHEENKQNIAQRTKKNNITDTSSTSKIAATTSDNGKKQIAGSGANLVAQSQTTVAATRAYGIAKNTPSSVAQAGINPAAQPANTGNTAFTAKVDTGVKKDLAYQLANRAQSLDITDSPATTKAANNKMVFTLIPTSPALKPGDMDKPKVVDNTPVSKGMQALFDKDAQNRATQNTEEQKTIDKKVEFAIYAATYVNYAKGSNKQFNTGGGATADIRLTDNLRLSTGVSIGQNTLTYANNITSTAVPAALMTAASHNYTASATSMLYSVVPSSSNLNANLVNLDIPVDLKYVFNPQKGNTYVSAGFSSGTFINESYSTTYNYNAPNNSSIQQSGDDTHKSFDNFYFAQMLNVSFGVGYPVGKNQLIIEPFFKYPLNGLGDQHILFGSGGLNLKFNFDPPKSKH